MAVEITQIKLGFDQCYVLKADGIVAVDAGALRPRSSGRLIHKLV